MTYIKEGAVEKWLDCNGNITHYRNPETQLEYWQSFDFNGKLTRYDEHYKNQAPTALLYEYDEFGNCIRTFSPDGAYETRSEYDELGNVVYYIDSFGLEEFFEYDGEELVYSKSDGKEILHRESYDDFYAKFGL